MGFRKYPFVQPAVPLASQDQLVGKASMRRSVTEPKIPSPLRIPAKYRDKAATQDASEVKDMAKQLSGSASGLPMSSEQPKPVPNPSSRTSEAAPRSNNTVKDTRLVQSTPVNLPGSVSNVLPSSKEPAGSTQSSICDEPSPTKPPLPGTAESDSARPDAIILGDGTMAPAKDGGFGRCEGVKIKVAHRVPSMAAIVGMSDQTEAQPSPSSEYSDSTAQVCHCH
jgi:hypothetical protein